MADARTLSDRRRQRTRWRLRQTCGGRPRLSVFRSNKHIYAQVIDDDAGRTIVAASSIDKSLREESGKRKPLEVAEDVGRLVAERALAAGVNDVVFDRGGYRYHGRIKSLADAARNAGLKF
jgi:large subunit ribosomal protein L18